MRETIHPTRVIAREQAKMRKRARRDRVLGERIEIPARNGTIDALLYRGGNDRPGFVILEVHGGGFMYNTAWDDDDFCAYIHRRLQIPVVACNYRVAPGHQFPVGLEDVYACAEYVSRLPELQASPDKVILWGHSAGANLAAGACLLAKERGGFSPALLVLDYPYMDAYRKSWERAEIRCSVPGKLMDTFAHYYTREETLRDPLVSPALTPCRRLSGMPRTFLLLCGKDNLNAGGKAYGKRLKRAGVPVTVCYVREALHGFIENHFNYRYVPLLTKLQMTHRQRQLAKLSTEHICAWIQRRLRNTHDK